MTEGWTYGAEHEWADWDTRRPLPPGFGRDRKDYTIVNSTGVANDPKDRLHHFGGEINTPPTHTIADQVGCMEQLMERYPEATVNYRSNLHLHIRVPGLRDDLGALKRVQCHIHEWMPRVLPVIEPLKLDMVPYPIPLEAIAGRQRRLRRMRVSHHTLLTSARVRRQLEASTIDDFFAAEVPHTKDGRPQWHLQPRVCVNLRQLRETDTVEFRHWPGTMDPNELRSALIWCSTYMRYALEARPIDSDLLANVAKMPLPKFQPYDHWLEERYRRTVHDGTIPRDQLPAAIAQVLSERRPS